MHSRVICLQVFLKLVLNCFGRLNNKLQNLKQKNDVASETLIVFVLCFFIIIVLLKS